MGVNGSEVASVPCTKSINKRLACFQFNALALACKST